MLTGYYKGITLAYFIVLNLCDMLTTHVALRNGALEGNPVATHILDSWGEPMLYAIKASAIICIAMLGAWRGFWRTLWVANAIILLVVVNNLMHV